jgi:hypothetical protein
MCRQNGTFVSELSLFSSKDATKFEARVIGMAHACAYAREHAHWQKRCDANSCKIPCNSDENWWLSNFIVREAKFINRLGFETRTRPIRLLLFSWRYNPLWLYFHSPVAGFSLLVFSRFLDHTKRRATVGRTPLDE